MSELHEALKDLSPVDFADVPLDNLAEWLQSHLESGELICNSVPQPPGGEPFHSSKPKHSEPDLAASSKDISVSSARSPDPHSLHASFHGAWGKPYKLGAKDNPLDVQVYKMAAKDKYGAWFARRSVHEGISFSRMRKAMRWEFPASMAVEGGPGAGAVRGLAVDSRLEQHKVGQVGQMEVFQLSAQFPGPTTPREFISLLMVSENALSEKSAADGKHIPRHLMVVSKPCEHPEAHERSGYIRGKYESVELIREIPLHKRSDKSASTSNLLEKHSGPQSGRDRGNTISYAESRGPDAKGEHVDNHESSKDEADPELNPIEWIMITRSDPGGGIPRFMVERGTPGGIVADVSKLFDWACSNEDIPDPDEEDVDELVERRKSEAPLPAPDTGMPESHNDQLQAGEESNGILASAKNAVTAGVEAYAPTAVVDMLHVDPKPADDVSDSSSTSSYESADDYLDDTVLSTASLPLSDTLPSDASTKSLSRVGTGFSSHDKKLLELEAHKKKLEQKLSKKRESEQNRLASSQGKSATEAAKAKERHERELKKLEERQQREMKKLEERKDKEVEKARRKREKQNDKDMLSRVTRERDDFRRRVEIVQRENELLREQIGEVQRENTVLVQKITKGKGGEEVLSAVRGELGKKQGKQRPESMRSYSSVA